MNKFYVVKLEDDKLIGWDGPLRTDLAFQKAAETADYRHNYIPNHRISVGLMEESSFEFLVDLIKQEEVCAKVVYGRDVSVCQEEYNQWELRKKCVEEMEKDMIRNEFMDLKDIFMKQG